MMEKAIQKIRESDVVLLEASEGSFGVGVEAGYAFAESKKIITIFNRAGDGSRTLEGISGHYLSYKDIPDLSEKLKEIFQA